MTPEEQRIAIAEACGWELQECEELQPHYPGGLLPTKVKRWFCKTDGMLALPHKDIPNYPEDLNACFEMEKVLLTTHKAADYANNIRLILGLKPIEPDHYVVAIEEFYIAHATAAQRCEAFCRVMWPERWGK